MSKRSGEALEKAGDSQGRQMVCEASGPRRARARRYLPWTGRVNNTGLIEVPMGTLLREVVFDIGGGIPDGKEFKAVQTGGPSGGCIPEPIPRYADGL